jgi:ribosomal protein S18 acetylase RimI-like enzyme
MRGRTGGRDVLSHREVRPEDVSRICSFPQTAEDLYFLFPKATHPLTPEQLRRAIEQRFDSTVVLLEDRVCGFANFYVRDVSGACAIGNVVVAPEARAKGVGRYLIETMIRKALLRHRAEEVRISCFNRNVAGLLLYAKLGFTPHAVEPRLDQQGARVALIHMRLGTDATNRYRRS